MITKAVSENTDNQKNNIMNLHNLTHLEICQWITSNAQGMSSIPGQGTKLPHAAGLDRKDRVRLSILFKNLP